MKGFSETIAIVFKAPGKKWILISIVFLTCGCKTGEKESLSKDLVANINIDAQRPPISKYLFGMFLEHLGNADVGDLIDDCLSAEVLDDRKFFYPVDSRSEQVPVNKRDSVNQWVPLNQAQDVVMDSSNAYVGVHSPKIILRKSSSEGISQSGLSVVANKNYVGRIVLAGSPGVTVSISLIWGPGASDRTDFKIDRLTKD